MIPRRRLTRPAAPNNHLDHRVERLRVPSRTVALLAPRESHRPTCRPSMSASDLAPGRDPAVRHTPARLDPVRLRPQPTGRRGPGCWHNQIDMPRTGEQDDRPGTACCQGNEAETQRDLTPRHACSAAVIGPGRAPAWRRIHVRSLDRRRLRPTAAALPPVAPRPTGLVSSRPLILPRSEDAGVSWSAVASGGPTSRSATRCLVSWRRSSKNGGHGRRRLRGRDAAVYERPPTPEGERRRVRGDRVALPGRRPRRPRENSGHGSGPCPDP